VQETNSLPPSKWQQLARFTTETGVPMQEPTHPKRTTYRQRSATQSQVIQQEDPFGFDFTHLDEAPDDTMTLGDVNGDDPTVTPGEQQTPAEPPDPEQHRHPAATRRSACQPNPTRRLIETAYAVLDETEAVEDYEVQLLAEDPIAFAANSSDPDTLYFNDAMNADDSAEFKKAMLQKVNAHTDNDHWEVWLKADVPVGQDILPSVWAFRRKRRIDTREVYKYKAWLNIHGGMQEHGVNYWESYSPVVNWFSIQLCLTLALLFQWKTRQIDFVLAFPQAEVECDLYMHLPRGLTFSGVHRVRHCLKLKKNLYGSRQAGRVWNQHLVNGLVNILKFKQSVIDECVFYRGTTMLLIYVDDGTRSFQERVPTRSKPLFANLANYST
jgi:hypothetical protein